MGSYVITAKYYKNDVGRKYTEVTDSFESAVKLFIDVDHSNDYALVKMWRIAPSYTYDKLDIEEVDKGVIYEYAWKKRL